VMNKTTIVFVKKGSKNVTVPAAAERRSLVTVVCIICANGNQIPPAVIFPRANYKDFMIAGGFPGTLGLASPSGWINNELFVSVLEHFTRHTNASKSKFGSCRHKYQFNSNTIEDLNLLLCFQVTQFS